MFVTNCSIGERLMQVIQTNADGLKREFKIVVTADQLETRMQDKLAEIARTVRIPGFRPGKVPMKIVRQKYGPSVLGEVLETAVNDGTQKSLEDNKLRPAMQPKVEITSYTEGSDLEFSVALEVLPEVTAMDFSTITLVRETAAVPEQEIEDTLKRLAERSENTELAERASQSGDVVVIDFVGKIDDVAFPGGTADGYSLKIGSNTFIPGFEDQLIGKSAGDKVDVNVSFPESYGNEELAGKPALFEVTVNEVRAVTPAAIDDELAKKVGMESLDALKDAIRSEIGNELGELTRNRLKRALMDALSAGHDFEVPSSMVDGEFNAIWEQLETERKAGRSDPSDEGKDDETLKTEYRALAERRVRLGLLLADVGQKNGVSVTQEDVNKALLAEARRYPGQEHLVFQYYKNNPDAMNSLRAPIFEDKVIDLVLSLAKIEDKEISLDDLRKDPEEAESASE